MTDIAEEIAEIIQGAFCDAPCPPLWRTYCDAAREVLAAFRPEFDAPDHAVEVKRLNWHDYEIHSTAPSIIGVFRIDLWEGFANIHIGITEIKIGLESDDLLQSAKDYAQSYFDHEIRSQVTTRPASEVAADAQEKALREALNICDTISKDNLSSELNRAFSAKCRDKIQSLLTTDKQSAGLDELALFGQEYDKGEG